MTQPEVEFVTPELTRRTGSAIYSKEGREHVLHVTQISSGDA